MASWKKIAADDVFAGRAAVLPYTKPTTQLQRKANEDYKTSYKANTIIRRNNSRTIKATYKAVLKNVTKG